MEEQHHDALLPRLLASLSHLYHIVTTEKEVQTTYDIEDLISKFSHHFLYISIMIL